MCHKSIQDYMIFTWGQITVMTNSVNQDQAPQNVQDIYCLPFIRQLLGTHQVLKWTNVRTSTVKSYG